MVETAVWVTVCALAMAVCAVDIAQRRIPNKLLIALGGIRVFAAALAALGFVGNDFSLGYLVPQTTCALTAAALLLAVGGLASRFSGDEALGFGDVKLVFVLCLFIKPQNLFLYGCLLGVCAGVAGIVALARSRGAKSRKAGNGGRNRGWNRSGKRPWQGSTMTADLMVLPSLSVDPVQASSITFPFAPALVAAFAATVFLQLFYLPI